MQKETDKFADSLIFEGMTSIRAVIKAIDESISDRKIEAILYDKDRMHKIAKEVGYFKAVSQKYGFELIESTKEELDKITLGTSHGGIVARACQRTIPSLSELKADGKRLVLLFGAVAQIHGKLL